MKLASYRDGSRDGQLVVVSRDGASAHFATGIASRLQQVLDDWNFLSPQLEDLFTTLNHGKARHAFPFEPQQCMAPLPRAFQWAGGMAYLSHARRLWPARGDHLPATLETEPLMHQRGSDHFLGPTEAATFASAEQGIDFGPELVVVTGDLPMGSTPAQALESVRLLGLANPWALRHLGQHQPATAFAPLFVTPDELGEAWQGGRVHLTVSVALNGQTVGLLDTGPAMHFHFGELLAQLAKTREVRAGSLVGSGTVSNDDTARGVACLAEKRALGAQEGKEASAPKAAFMQGGDRVRIEIKGRDGQSLFGAIDQPVRISG